MKAFFLLCIFSSFAMADGPIQRSDLGEIIEEPMVPGTRAPLEKLNTAPASPPLEEERRQSRFTLEKDLERKRPGTAKGSPLRNDVKPRVPLGRPSAPRGRQMPEGPAFDRPGLFDQEVEDFTEPRVKSRRP